MRSVPTFLLVRLIPCLMIVLCWVTPIRAQSPETSLGITVDVSSRVRFYQLDSAGNTGLLYELSSDFSVYPVGETDWVIMDIDAIQVAPQGDKVAFVALRSQQASTFQEAALFWLEFAQPVLQQVAVPGYFDVAWSPDSDQLLLTLAEDAGLYAAVSQTLINHDAYLFDLPTKTLTQLGLPSEARRIRYQWLDSQRVLYGALTGECEGACVRAFDLHVLDLSTQMSTRLTQIGAQLERDLGTDVLQYYSVCYPDISARSPLFSRLYYVVSCRDTSDQVQSFLYSTDLAGLNRLELNPLSLTDDSFYNTIRDIHIIEEVVYVSMASEIRPASGGAVATFTQWRVLALHSQALRTVLELRFNGAASSILSVVAFSPDAVHIALAGMDRTSEIRGYVVVVNVSSGDILHEMHTQGAVCNIAWVDVGHLAYTSFESTCETTSDSPLEIRLLDITTGRQDVISTGDGAPLMMIASP